MLRYVNNLAAIYVEVEHPGDCCGLLDACAGGIVASGMSLKRAFKSHGRKSIFGKSSIVFYIVIGQGPEPRKGAIFEKKKSNISSARYSKNTCLRSKF